MVGLSGLADTVEGGVMESSGAVSKASSKVVIDLKQVVVVLLQV
jgi:hypothetical protein